VVDASQIEKGGKEKRDAVLPVASFGKAEAPIRKIERDDYATLLLGPALAGLFYDA